MVVSAFSDPEQRPDSQALSRILNATNPFWIDTLTAVSTQDATASAEWHYGTEQTGWTLRIRQGDRTLAHLIPRQDMYLAHMILSDETMVKLKSAGLCEAIARNLEDARQLVNGKGIVMEVRKSSDLDILNLLLRTLMRD